MLHFEQWQEPPPMKPPHESQGRVRSTIGSAKFVLLIKGNYPTTNSNPIEGTHKIKSYPFFLVIN